MSRHFNKNELDEIYKIYQEEGKSQAIKFMLAISPKLEFIDSKSLNFRLRKIIKYYNNSMEDLLLKKRGPTKNKQKKSTPQEIQNIINNLTDEEKNIIIKRYIEIIQDNNSEIKKKEVNLLIGIRFIWLAKLLFFHRETIANYSKKPYAEKQYKETKLDKLIKKVFKQTGGTFGRVRLSKYILKEHKIDINPRTLARKLKKMGLKTLVRQPKKPKESKDLTSNNIDLVQRDYNDKDNRNIIATDVSYIKAPRDIKKYQNYVYLSIVISHKTKEILDAKLSTVNDIEFIMKNLKFITKSKYKNEGYIIHSDHGSQYTSQKYKEFVESTNGKISMSRIGNSLDNREAEYFFSNIKSECLNFVDYSKITFEELNLKIKKYLKWYNESRIQSILGWKSPKQYTLDLIN